MTRRCRYNNTLDLLYRNSVVHVHFSSTSYVCRKKNQIYFTSIMYNFICFLLFIYPCISITNALPLSLEQKIL